VSSVSHGNIKKQRRGYIDQSRLVEKQLATQDNELLPAGLMELLMAVA
jgi:hypothetical protein